MEIKLDREKIGDIMKKLFFLALVAFVAPLDATETKKPNNNKQTTQMVAPNQGETITAQLIVQTCTGSNSSSPECQAAINAIKGKTS